MVGDDEFLSEDLISLSLSYYLVTLFLLSSERVEMLMYLIQVKWFS